MTYYISFILILSLSYIIYNKKRQNFVHCLMYHNISDTIGNAEISVEEFDLQMAHIQHKTTFKMEELKSLNYQLPKNSILVTFDDGYKSNYILAFPILKKYGIKATIFLNTRYIGTNEEYLNWDEIREMYQSGLVDFQLHTHSHGLTAKTVEVFGFFDENTSKYLKRESYNLFFDGLYDNIQDADKLNGLPIFKMRSQISLAGFRPKNHFVEKYRQLEKQADFIHLSDKDKKKKLTQLFNDNTSELFDKVSKAQFKQILENEITKNKYYIQQELNKEADCLAYPWGHRYKGNIKDLKELGVNVFVTTKKGANSLHLNPHSICRINGDEIKNITDFERALADGSSAFYRKIKKTLKI
ncbi:polysaccharide deacetylase [Cricetibacter osteomyelitidis]|uniref:Polysaccharide deacetylase n=1 Tax=Cricetibacter osteomyelitidis TaxID=1521931 RepID=A0A4R2TLP1_9PAST|nr:polysaccharide deacetylase family protein [Cricetibacter osteomyelitidis]TCP95782.1 polysaccharide deacetylase [Cricetibacter osteomyelitidis]